MVPFAYAASCIEVLKPPPTTLACGAPPMAFTYWIEMRPTLPGRYASGPDGLTNLAALAAAAPPPVGPGMPAPPAVGIPGQLIGRVGPNGAPFVVGSSYKGKAAGSGKLQLRVGSSPYPQEPTGGYKVKVTVGGP